MDTKISLIRLATRSTTTRTKVVVAPHPRFVYYVSVPGVTGVEADAGHRPTSPRPASGLPVAVGFGIKTPNGRAMAGGRRRWCRFGAGRKRWVNEA